MEEIQISAMPLSVERAQGDWVETPHSKALQSGDRWRMRLWKKLITEQSPAVASENAQEVNKKTAEWGEFEDTVIM